MTPETITFIAIIAVLILIIICFILNMINTSKINALYDYAEDGDLTGALQNYYDKLDALSQTITENSNPEVISRIAACENQINETLRKTAVVNFDAYDDVTGNLSFALAVLNSNDDGFIMTSLYGHNSCNTYIRNIKAGKCDIYLLDEEKDALEQAVMQ